MIEFSTRFITTLSAEPRFRTVALAGYYLAILCGVLAIATLGAFDTPPFVYQGF